MERAMRLFLSSFAVGFGLLLAVFTAVFGVLFGLAYVTFSL